MAEEKRSPIPLKRFRIEPRADYGGGNKCWLVVFDIENGKYITRPTRDGKHEYYVRFQSSDDVWKYIISDEFKAWETKNAEKAAKTSKK